MKLVEDRQVAPTIQQDAINPRTPEYLIAIVERFEPILAPDAKMEQSEFLIDMNALKLLAGPSAPPIAA